MKFTLLLFILSKKLKSAAKKKIAFQEKIKEHNASILIKTADNKRGRLFTFKDGTVTSTKGVAETFDLALIWSDADTGFKVMLNGSNRATMDALTNGKLKLEGKAELALWFTTVIKEMDKKEK